MERTKKYNADQIGDYNTLLLNQIEIKLNPDEYPEAFFARVEYLVKNGMLRSEAENLVMCTPILLDVYYSTEKDNEGLFCVESEIVECSTIYNPYSGVEMEDFD